MSSSSDSLSSSSSSPSSSSSTSPSSDSSSIDPREAALAIFPLLFRPAGPSQAGFGVRLKDLLDLFGSSQLLAILDALDEDLLLHGMNLILYSYKGEDYLCAVTSLEGFLTLSDEEYEALAVVIYLVEQKLQVQLSHHDHPLFPDESQPSFSSSSLSSSSFSSSPSTSPSSRVKRLDEFSSSSSFSLSSSPSQTVSEDPSSSSPELSRVDQQFQLYSQLSPENIELTRNEIEAFCRNNELEIAVKIKDLLLLLEKKGYLHLVRKRPVTYQYGARLVAEFSPHLRLALIDTIFSYSHENQ